MYQRLGLLKDKKKLKIANEFHFFARSSSIPFLLFPIKKYAEKKDRKK